MKAKKIISLSLVFFLTLSFASVSFASEDVSKHGADSTINYENVDSEQLVEMSPDLQQDELIEESVAEEIEAPVDSKEDTNSSSQGEMNLELGVRTKCDIDWTLFRFKPEEDTEYQIWLEFSGYLAYASTSVYATKYIESYVCDAKGDYLNIFLEGGGEYIFSFAGLEYATLKQNPIEQIKILQNKPTNPSASELYKFVAPNEGNYTFRVEGEAGTNPEVYINKRGLSEPASESDKAHSEKTIKLKEREICYVEARKARNLTVFEDKGNDNARIDYMVLLSDLWNYNPPIREDWFNLNHLKNEATAHTAMEKPYIRITMDPNSLDSTPVLRDSKGKVVKWTYEDIDNGNRKVYAVKIGVNAATRKYTITVTPASGDTSKNVVYAVNINPNAEKPSAFKVRASDKSNSITLTWGLGAYTDGYKIYRSTKKDSSFKLIGTLKNPNTTRFNDKNLPSGKTYYYKVVPYRYMNEKQHNGTPTAVLDATVRK